MGVNNSGKSNLLQSIALLAKYLVTEHFSRYHRTKVYDDRELLTKGENEGKAELKILFDNFTIFRVVLLLKKANTQSSTFSLTYT